VAEAKAKRGETTTSEEAKEESRAAGAHVCPVAFCPIGLALGAVQQAAPEVLDHLLVAAREFLLAAKAVVDARAHEVEEEMKRTKLERIEIA
jgi:hypothetical protein